MPNVVRIGPTVLHVDFLPSADAPTVVFVNALGTDLRLWDDVVAGLGRRVATLRYDKQGHGLSGLSAPALTMADHVGDLIGLLDRFEIARAVIVGDSIGGAIAQLAATLHPERVSGLVLLDTATRFGTAEAWAARIAAVRAGGTEAVADQVMERWFSAETRAADPVMVEGWRTMVARTPAEGYIASCEALASCDLTAETARLRLPVAVAVGSADGSTPIATVKALADLIPGAAFTIFEGVGHLPPAECPDDVVALILGFIDDHGLDRRW